MRTDLVDISIVRRELETVVSFRMRRSIEREARTIAPLITKSRFTMLFAGTMPR